MGRELWGIGVIRKRDKECEALSKRLRAVLGRKTTSKSLQLVFLLAVHATYPGLDYYILSLRVPKFSQMENIKYPLGC